MSGNEWNAYIHTKKSWFVIPIGVARHQFTKQNFKSRMKYPDQHAKAIFSDTFTPMGGNVEFVLSGNECSVQIYIRGWEPIYKIIHMQIWSYHSIHSQKVFVNWPMYIDPHVHDMGLLAHMTLVCWCRHFIQVLDIFISPP